MKKNKAQLAAKTERNGTSEDTLHDAVLKEILALSRADLGAEALAKFSTIELFLRIRGLFGNIQEAFVGQPFLPTLPPDAPANQNRVNAYMANVGRASKLLQFAIELVGMTSGMRMKPAASQAEKGGSDQTP